MEIKKTIVFNGKTYRLMGTGKYYLSQSKSNEGRRHAKGLHVAIWEYYNGREVPKGFCIHHKDHNTFNNNISNLECVPIRQHLSEHSKYNFTNEEYKRRNAKGLDAARDKANQWHRSEEGKRWHSEHAKGKRAKDKMCICKNCGKTFFSAYKDTEFCSQTCGYKYRAKQIEYTSVCLQCGKTFHYHKAVPSKPDRRFCSISCSTTYKNTHQKGKGL